MVMAHQQDTWSQQRLFEGPEESVRHGARGNGGTEPGTNEEGQATPASTRQRALTDDLMERIGERENLNRAYTRVKANQGAPGIDGMTVGELHAWSKEPKEGLIAWLLDGSDQPQAVGGEEIPKPGGGTRAVGKPTGEARRVQQAFLQVREELRAPTFSEASSGLRRGRNAHQAQRQAAAYVGEGRGGGGRRHPQVL